MINFYYHKGEQLFYNKLLKVRGVDEKLNFTNLRLNKFKKWNADSKIHKKLRQECILFLKNQINFLKFYQHRQEGIENV